MSSFTSELDIRDLGDRTFQLLSQFSYRVGGEDSNEIIIIPPGFITDFASVPRILWTILPPYGRHGKAAVLHDGLYKTKGFQGKYSRKDCDLIFLEAMEVLHVDILTRRTMYRGVRMFGWYEWNKKPSDRVDRIKNDTDLSREDIVRSPKPTFSVNE